MIAEFSRAAKCKSNSLDILGLKLPTLIKTSSEQFEVDHECKNDHREANGQEPPYPCELLSASKATMTASQVTVHKNDNVTDNDFPIARHIDPESIPIAPVREIPRAASAAVLRIMQRLEDELRRDSSERGCSWLFKEYAWTEQLHVQNSCEFYCARCSVYIQKGQPVHMWEDRCYCSHGCRQKASDKSCFDAQPSSESQTNSDSDEESQEKLEPAEDSESEAVSVASRSISGRRSSSVAEEPSSKSVKKLKWVHTNHVREEKKMLLVGRKFFYSELQSLTVARKKCEYSKDRTTAEHVEDSISIYRCSSWVELANSLLKLFESSLKFVFRWSKSWPGTNL